MATKFDPQAASKIAGKLISSADALVGLSVVLAVIGGALAGYWGTPTNDKFVSMAVGIATATVCGFAAYVPARVWALTLHVHAHTLLALTSRPEAAAPAVDRAA